MSVSLSSSFHAHYAAAIKRDLLQEWGTWGKLGFYGRVYLSVFAEKQDRERGREGTDKRLLTCKVHIFNYSLSSAYEDCSGEKKGGKIIVCLNRNRTFGGIADWFDVEEAGRRVGSSVDI